MIDEHGPFELQGDAELLQPLDALLASFVRQRRMKLSGEYQPCYRIVALCPAALPPAAAGEVADCDPVPDAGGALRYRAAIVAPVNNRNV